MLDERGSVTVFSLIALSSLILVFAVFSDFVRVRAAQSEAEEAARRAGRSLLAQFDSELIQYGLFGLDWSDERLDGVILAQQDGDMVLGNSNRFTLYSTAIDYGSYSAEPLYNLGDHRVFQHQVLERMKYVAGIEFGVEVTQKFAQGRTRIVQAEQYAKLSKELEDTIRQRGEALDRAWSTASGMAHSAMYSNVMTGLQPVLNQLMNELNEAERLNEVLRNKLSSPDLTQTEPSMELPSITVYSSIFFSEYKSGAGTLASLHGAWQTAVLELQNYMMERASNQAGNSAQNAEEELPDRTEELVSRVEELREQLFSYANRWLSERREEESKRKQEEQSSREQEHQQRQSAERELKNRFQRLQEACLPYYTADYHELTRAGGLFDKYKSYNEHIASGGMVEEITEDDAEQFLFQALQLTRFIADAAVELRDEVYINEYALTHFTFFTDSMNKGNTLRVNMGSQSSHRLQKQEAEYILYGLPDCRLNLAAMQAELFALRTAMRTIEALLEPKAVVASPSPLTALLKALAEGAIEANSDMEALLNGEAVELPFLKGFTMSYKDHLRLFYLLHSRDASVLSRMQSLIELNSGADLMQHYTAVRVRGSVQPSALFVKVRQQDVETVVSY